MNSQQRLRYFRLWQQAATAQGWDSKSASKRHEITGSCMSAIHRDGPAVIASRSTTDLDQAEITALFVFLEHLSAPSDPVASARWIDCQADYQAYNLARNTDHFQRQAGYGKRSRICRDRFDGRGGAEADGFAGPLDRKALQRRLITMSERARAAARRKEESGAGADPEACTPDAEPQMVPCSAAAEDSPGSDGSPFG